MHRERSPLAAQIGTRVRQARYEQSLSQEHLALAAGVSTRTLHNIEHGATGVQLDTLLRILSVLGMTLEITPRPAQRLTLESELRQLSEHP